MVTTADYIAADMVYAEGAEVDAVYKGDTLLWSNRPAVLNEATLWLDAQYSAAREPRVINRGTGGAALNAKYGSVLGAYVYDGALQPWDASSNHAAIPDAANLDITGDLEVYVRLRGDVAGLVGTHFFCTRREITAGVESFQIGISSSTFNIGQRVGGVSAYSTVADSTVLSDPTKFYWLHFMRVASTGVWSMEWQEAPTTVIPTSGWTAGTFTRTMTSGSLSASAARLFAGGSRGGSDPCGMEISRVVYNDGIGGTTIADVNYADCDDYATSFTATTGQTVTVTSTSSDTNDPLLLTHTGENYVHFTGGLSSELNFVGAAAGNPPTTQPTSWSESLDFMLLQVGTVQYITGTGSTHYYLGTTAAGLLDILWRDTSTGSGLRFQATVPLRVGVRYQLEFTVDLTTPGSRTIDYTLLADGVPLDVGMTKPIDVALGLLLTVINDVILGAHSTATASGFNGRIYSWSRSFTGSDLDRSFEFNGSDITDSGATTVTLTSGQEFTVLRATAGRKTVLATRPIWLLGTDDYLEVADNNLLDPGAGDFTVMAIARKWANQAIEALVAKREAISGADVNAGWALNFATPAGPVNRLYTYYSDGTDADPMNGASAAPAAVANTFGELRSVFMEVDRTASQATMYDAQGNAATMNINATAVNSSFNLRVGRMSGVGSAYLDGEVTAVAIWNRLLTPDEVTAISNYYGAV